MKKRGGTPRNIWMVTREYGDLAGAGGVKDVTAQLSRAMAGWTGRRVHVVLPCYGFMAPEQAGFEMLQDPGDAARRLEFEVDMHYAAEERREHLRVWHARRGRVDVYLLDSLRFREKDDVYTYSLREERADPLKRQGTGHHDYFAMNLLLQKGTLQLIMHLNEPPDIIHCHDGHTAVLPAIIRETPWLHGFFRHTGCVVTVHNAGAGYHQDVEDLPYARAMTGLPWQTIIAGRLGGSFDPLVTAGLYATLNTVSENYARELQYSTDDAQTGWLGHRLLEMGIELEGVTNGVDPEDYAPHRGKEIGLSAAYNPLDDDSSAARQRCRDTLISMLASGEGLKRVRQYGFLEENGAGPLFTFIGRLSTQKGVDILHDAVGQLAAAAGREFQLVVLGSGSSEMEEQLMRLTAQDECRGRVCFLAGFDPLLANRIYSAGDFFVVPSRYEPCGLTDFIAQLFGNLPIVHSVGGLIKVVDNETGFSYTGNTSEALVEAMKRAMSVFGDKVAMRAMQKHAIEVITEKYTWKVVKNHYLNLYKKAQEGIRTTGVTDEN
ncbi:MAG: glycogen synthase [Desulfopila sp.]